MSPDEIAETYIIRKLSPNETVGSFNCGDDDLNDFILNEAHLYGKARLAVSYVIENRKSKQVIGFFIWQTIGFPLQILKIKRILTGFERKDSSTRKELKAIRQ